MALRVAAENFTTIANVRAADSCGCVTGNDPVDADLTEFIEVASDMLAMLSAGRVVGRVTSTIRPCRKDDYFSCSCCGLDAIPLGDRDPVVSEVKIDGTALAVADYTLHFDRNGWNLVRVATDLRPNSWPSDQAMWRPDTEDDTFSITYTSGTYIDYVAEQAAIELVCDFAAADVTKTNQLPDGVTSATMGSVSVATASGLTLQERVERLQAGEVGPAVSRFRSLYAPTGRFISEVWAPELEPWKLTSPA